MTLNFRDGYCEYQLTIPQFFAQIPSAKKIETLYKRMWHSLETVSVIGDDGRYYDGREAMQEIDKAVADFCLIQNIDIVSPGFEFEEPNVKARIRRSLNTNGRVWHRQKEEFERFTERRKQHV